MRDWMVRQRKNRSQSDVAKSAGLSQAYYSSLENGNRGRRMSAQLMQRLAAAYEIPMEFAFSCELAYQTRVGEKGKIRTPREEV